MVHHDASDQMIVMVVNIRVVFINISHYDIVGMVLTHSLDCYVMITALHYDCYDVGCVDASIMVILFIIIFYHYTIC